MEFVFEGPRVRGASGWQLGHSKVQSVEVGAVSSKQAAQVPMYRPPGAALIDGLATAPGDIVVEKQRFSAFMGTELDHVLR